MRLLIAISNRQKCECRYALISSLSKVASMPLLLLYPSLSQLRLLASKH